MPQRLLDPINVRLTPQMRKRLDELADERTVPMSVLIREALDLAYVLKSVPLSRGPREPTCDPPAVPLASCPESPSAGSWRLPDTRQGLPEALRGLHGPAMTIPYHHAENTPSREEHSEP